MTRGVNACCRGVRFFPTTATVGRWLASSALSLPAGEVRIVARKLASGRAEFGLQQRQSDGSWGDRRLPRVRFFPTTAGVGRWLASSALTVRPSVEAEPRPEPVVEPEPQPEAEPEPQPDREPQPEPEGASAGSDVVGEAPGARAEPLTGDLPVPVFICAPAGVFDSSDLRAGGCWFEHPRQSVLPVAVLGPGGSHVYRGLSGHACRVLGRGLAAGFTFRNHPGGLLGLCVPPPGVCALLWVSEWSEWILDLRL